MPRPFHPSSYDPPFRAGYTYKLKKMSRSQWPRGQRRGSAAARMLRMWVRIPPGAWMSVCCECCVLSCGSLRRADHSSRGVIPTVVRHSLLFTNPVNVENLAEWGGALVSKTSKQTNRKDGA